MLSLLINHAFVVQNTSNKLSCISKIEEIDTNVVKQHDPQNIQS